MKYTWEESDVSPGILIKAPNKEPRKVIAVGTGTGMYKFGMYNDSGNYCSVPMEKKEFVETLNSEGYEPSWAT